MIRLKLENQYEIEQLNVGEEMDSLIEFYVFDKTKSMYFKPKNYSTDLLSAWEIIASDKFVKKVIELTRMNDGYEHLQYTAILTTYDKVSMWTKHKMYGITVQEAICKAALLALAINKERSNEH